MTSRMRAAEPLADHVLSAPYHARTSSRGLTKLANEAAAKRAEAAGLKYGRWVMATMHMMACSVTCSQAEISGWEMERKREMITSTSLCMRRTTRK